MPNLSHDSQYTTTQDDVSPKQVSQKTMQHKITPQKQQFAEDINLSLKYHDNNEWFKFTTTVLSVQVALNCDQISL